MNTTIANEHQQHLLVQKKERSANQLVDRRRCRRTSILYRQAHASRERSRVESFNRAFEQLRRLLPTLPPDKKLTKIEILRLAISYMTYLDCILML
ncbi:Helix-loop-helix protein [Trichinella spiralis]|uniref:Helix-loop-helix protein n=2 Tax=Trichinella spiralis TaxID=6334 RepID=A0ABR3KJD0_TRISP